MGQARLKPRESVRHFPACTHSLTSLVAPCHPCGRYLVAQMNSSLDYSYMDTPRRSRNATATPPPSSDPSSRIVLRSPQANPRLPAFLEGQLAWGSPPAVPQVSGTEVPAPLLQIRPDKGPPSPPS